MCTFRNVIFLRLVHKIYIYSTSFYLYIYILHSVYSVRLMKLYTFFLLRRHNVKIVIVVITKYYFVVIVSVNYLLHLLFFMYTVINQRT